MVDPKRNNSHRCRATAGGGPSGHRSGSRVPASGSLGGCPAPQGLERSRSLSRFASPTRRSPRRSGGSGVAPARRARGLFPPLWRIVVVVVVFPAGRPSTSALRSIRRPRRVSVGLLFRPRWPRCSLGTPDLLSAFLGRPRGPVAPVPPTIPEEAVRASRVVLGIVGRSLPPP